MHIAIHNNVVNDVLPMTCSAVHVVESASNPLTVTTEAAGSSLVVPAISNQWLTNLCLLQARVQGLISAAPCARLVRQSERVVPFYPEFLFVLGETGVTTFFQTLHSQTHQFRTIRQIPIGVAQVNMPEKDGQDWQAPLRILSGAIPLNQSLDRKAVAEVMKVWAMAGARRPQSSSLGEGIEGPPDSPGFQPCSSSGYEEEETGRPARNRARCAA
jgi:hypothetical protein